MGLTNNGRDFLAGALIGDETTLFDNTNAYIGVGDGATAFAKTDTDLVGTNKYRAGMDSGYPTRSANSIDFKATFGGAVANFTWNEWAIFNAATGGIMLNRKVENLGTKAGGSTWVLTVTVTLTN